MGTNNIKEIVSCITEEIKALKENQKLTDMEYGQLLAYTEVLSVIQSACAGYDLKGIGLDFDVDERYMK